MKRIAPTTMMITATTTATSAPMRIAGLTIESPTNNV